MKTAVEWLEDNLHYLHSTKWNDILEQAKEMEKEQIIEAMKIGVNCGLYNYKSGEDYYKRTYKKK